MDFDNVNSSFNSTTADSFHDPVSVIDHSHIISQQDSHASLIAPQNTPVVNSCDNSTDFVPPIPWDTTGLNEDSDVETLPEHSIKGCTIN